ncbi:MAG: beta-N-acetylhexosaminidase [Acetobacteraceae bacterium]|nr:beta-N-acetylhexosaminidase [Acetobacteraceae bacterium]
MKAAIVGIAGPVLLEAEVALFRAAPPAGVILFSRNIQDPAQLAALVASLRAVLPETAVLMVDQEGGRVARLRPPHWRGHPPAAMHGQCYDRHPAAGLRAAWLTGALIGLDCAAAGFDVAAAPVLDLSVPDAHDVIGDRALAQDPEVVARLGRAMAAGLMAAGVQPVGKHAPGHGRARVDSHKALPRVEANHLDADLLPFVLNADLPWLMTAHIVYPAFDPTLPATLSPTVIGTVIRERIGFKGTLVTDDLAMHALSGRPADLACQALAAGCDIALYCRGDLPATASLLAECPALEGPAAARFARARTEAAWRRMPLDASVLAAERDRVLA